MELWVASADKCVPMWCFVPVSALLELQHQLPTVRPRVEVAEVSEKIHCPQMLELNLQKAPTGKKKGGKTSFLARHDKKKEKEEECAELCGLLILGDVFIFLCLSPPQLFLMSAIWETPEGLHLFASWLGAPKSLLLPLPATHAAAPPGMEGAREGGSGGEWQRGVACGGRDSWRAWRRPGVRAEM